MIADFRKRVFCELSNVPQREVDANDPLWQQRIDQLLRIRSTLPPAGDPTEYGKAFGVAPFPWTVCGLSPVTFSSSCL